MGFELKHVLKMLQKPVRFKMVSNKLMKQQEDAQQEAQDELIDSSDLYAMKKEVLVQSRNSYNIQYESKHRYFLHLCIFISLLNNFLLALSKR